MKIMKIIIIKVIKMKKNNTVNIYLYIDINIYKIFYNLF